MTYRPHMEGTTDVTLTLHNDLHIRLLKAARREFMSAEEIVSKALNLYLAHAEDIHLAAQYARPIDVDVEGSR